MIYYRSLIIGCLLFVCGRMYAQEVTFTPPLSCIYMGVDNAVSIHVVGYSDTDVVAVSGNGRVERRGGNFSFRPDRLAPTVVTIYVKTKQGPRKQVAVREVETRCIEFSRPTFCGRNGGSIPAQLARQGISVTAHTIKSTLCGNAMITHMRVQITEHDKGILDREVSGTDAGVRFCDDQRICDAISKLHNGQILTISDIRYVGPAGPECNGTFPAMTFYITD